MNIEKLAHSVFENAEQEPPKEVWEGIEARLHSKGSAGAGDSQGATSALRGTGRHRWLWALGAGVAVTGSIIVFALTGMPHREPVAQLVLNDTVAEEVFNQATRDFVDESADADRSTAKATNTVSHSSRGGEAQAMQEKQQTVRAAEQDSRRESTASRVGETNSLSADEEPFFDLLEYQLSSHEYDIPATAQPSATQTKKDNAAQSSSAEDAKHLAACKETVEINISIPNVVTPNADGHNDCWRIPDLAKYGRASVQIFTAQRKRVYASDNYNGDFCGDDLPSGNYFYELNIRQYNYVRRGVLVIKR